MSDNSWDRPIRGDVSLSLHPGAMDGVAQNHELVKEATLGSEALGHTRRALGLQYDWAGKLQDANKALHAKVSDKRKTFNPGRDNFSDFFKPIKHGPRWYFGYEHELHDVASRKLEEVHRKVDEAIVRVKAIGAELEKKVNNAMADPDAATPEGIAVAGQIRAHVVALPGSRRLVFLAAAIDRDDRRTVHAVLSGPPYLSGLDEATVRTVRESAAKRWAPLEATQAEGVAKLGDWLERSKTITSERLEELAELVGDRAPGRRSKKALEELGK